MRCEHKRDADTCWECRQGRRLARQVRKAQLPNGRCQRCGNVAPRGELHCEPCALRAARNESRLARRADRSGHRPAVRRWRLAVDLRAWQAEALEIWQSRGHRGVVEAATGTGKTTLACAVIEQLHRQHGDDLRVAVVVPTISLAKQWRSELGARLALAQSMIGEQHSKEEVSWEPSKPVLVTVLNTASKRLPAVARSWADESRHVLLIVDECHRAGAPSFAKIFDAPFDSALGLSATPERADDGEEEFVYPKIGDKIFEYPLLRALDDGVVCELTAVNLYVDFTPSEKASWEQSSTDLSNALTGLLKAHRDLDMSSSRFFIAVSHLAENEDEHARRLIGVLARRRDLISKCEARRECAEEVMAWIAEGGRRSIVFHDTVNGAERSEQFLATQGCKTALEHSQLKSDERTEAIRSFRSGRARALVTVKALDEGLDVPEADVALIVAGSRSHRQRIQRIGRVLRQGENKHAVVVTVLVKGTPEETVVGARDDDRLGTPRVRHHRFKRGVDVGDLIGMRSTHSPDASLMRSAIDRLTYRALTRRNSP